MEIYGIFPRMNIVYSLQSNQNVKVCDTSQPYKRVRAARMLLEGNLWGKEMEIIFLLSLARSSDKQNGFALAYLSKIAISVAVQNKLVSGQFWC